MPVATPMVIRLYDANDEYQEFTRNFVPWKLLKLAIKLYQGMKDFDGITDMPEEMIDSLAALVVEVFGNQFSIEDLNEKADVTEMITVINQIVAKASGGVNPTNPGQARK